MLIELAAPILQLWALVLKVLAQIINDYLQVITQSLVHSPDINPANLGISLLRSRSPG